MRYIDHTLCETDESKKRELIEERKKFLLKVVGAVPVILILINMLLNGG